MSTFTLPLGAPPRPAPPITPSNAPVCAFGCAVPMQPVPDVENIWLCPSCGSVAVLDGAVRDPIRQARELVSSMLSDDSIDRHDDAVYATAIEAAARVCERRAYSLQHDSGFPLSASEASKCAIAIRKLARPRMDACMDGPEAADYEAKTFDRNAIRAMFIARWQRYMQADPPREDVDRYETLMTLALTRRGFRDITPAEAVVP